MNYQDYHFTFAILNKPESRYFKFEKSQEVVSLILGFICLRWEAK